MQNNQIIAQAFHQGAGTTHAEVLLFEKIPANVTDITLYVTLEPCNHWGKTPPCVDAIIRQGITTVVYGHQDPNPQVKENNTPQLLRAAGITVIYHPLSQIQDFYRSYDHWVLTHKPWVQAKIAQSLDGKIAGEGGKRMAISNELCATFTHEQRRYTDVILTTAKKTINQDDPLLNARINHETFSKPLAILDRQGLLNPKARALQEAKHCYVYYDQNLPAKASQGNLSYHPLPTLNGQLDLQALLSHLGAQGFHDVWVEAGASLFNALHRLDLVDRTYIYIAPKLLGSLGLPAYQQLDFFARAQHIYFQNQNDNSIATIEWHPKISEALCLQD